MISKTFISYSWDDDEHVDWVLELANKLVEYGLDIVLDQYELAAGHDINHFMDSYVVR